jgi:hypothetical protein
LQQANEKDGDPRVASVEAFAQHRKKEKISSSVSQSRLGWGQAFMLGQLDHERRKMCSLGLCPPLSI